MKRLLLLFAAILMASTGMWAETVDYLYPVYNTDGVPTSGIKEWKTASVNATVVTDASEPVTWTAGWYVVKGSDVTLSQGAICSGNVHLILADGAKLTATGIAKTLDSTPGIQVSGDGNSLTIYGQTAQTGILKATGKTYSAGIGGISTNGLQDGSNITINGGTITADGGSQAAAIGGGLRGNGSNITINGGTVTAKGSAAGIGGGLRGNGSNITINGGTMIHAKAGNGSAGIGGGENGNGSNITINSGTVWAEGSRGGAGIGGGYAGQENFEGGQGSSIIIKGGTITAEGEDGSDGIGNGANATTPSSDIFVATWCIVKAGSSSNSTTEITTDRTSTTDIATDLAGKQYVTVEPMKVAVTYGDNITVSPAFDSGAEIEAGTQITFTAADRTADSYGLWGFYKESTFDTHITTGVNNQTYTVMVTDAAISVYARYEKYASASYIYPVYNDPDDVTKGVKDWETETVNAYVVTSSATPVTWGEAGKETWYVVTGEDVQLSQGAICAGKVNLILADGAKLTATGNIISTLSDTPGIQVSGEGNSLAIYGQTAQSGQLETKSYGTCAGIGGEENGSASNITINGGTVTATGGASAAGIGGGRLGSGSYITINGGTVTAIGGNAGIGGGLKGSGSNITINGGTVTANSGSEGAGIGGGYLGSGSNITINGGTVTANGGRMAAGIGGGYKGNGSNITINGGTVTATGGEDNGKYGDGIGSGFNGSASSYIFVAKNLLVKAGNTEETMYVIGNYTDLDFASGFAGKRFATIEPEPAPEEKEVTYIDENGEEQKVKANVVFSRSFPVTWGEANKTTWYAVTHADVQLFSPVCQGDVRLILADGAKLTATGADNEAGIQVSGDGNSLTIYGQNAQSGQLIATGGYYAAGIGGGNTQDGSNITINGSIVKATSGYSAAGIGGGNWGSGSNITINGGTVTANCRIQGAGIGGGFRGNGSNITINGGTITATTEGWAAGIGGGYEGSGSKIIINGGTVTATSGYYGAGIGGGTQGNGSNITINGGTVTANGGEDAAGIGSGKNGPAASDIFVATILTLKAGSTENPADAITNNGGDLTESLAGQKYATVSDAICNITANQDPNNKANYYSTFYSNKKAYSVPEGVTAYTGAVDGDVLKLTAIESGIIPAGEAVILRLTTENNTATKKQLTLTAMTTKATKSTDNKLVGTDEAMTLGANDYALSLGQKGVGFYLWKDKSIDAHKAYLTLESPTMAKAFTFMFDDGETTAIEQPAINGKQSGDTYNLNGVRVNDNYKGIVIKNGKKIYQK